MNVGLSAHAAVQWLLRTESEVYNAVRAFIVGQRDSDIINVAGPPTIFDQMRFADKLAQVVPLPCVQLKCRMVRHHLTGEPGVEVTCSDRDLEEITRWRRDKLLAPMRAA